MNRPHTCRKHRGFTLTELVVVIIILGVLAAVAIPKFIDIGKNAQIASLKTLQGALISTANNVYVICQTIPSCDITAGQQHPTIGGRNAYVEWGYLGAGDVLNGGQIDSWIDYNGFTIDLLGQTRHRFNMDGAPDPVNCSVTYTNAFSATQGFVVTVATSGC